MEVLNFSQPYQLILEKLQSWFDLLVKMFPNLIVAILLLVLFYVGAIVICKIFDRYVGSRFQSRTVAELTSFFLKVVIVVTGILCAIGVLGLHKTVVSLLAGAGLAGLALGLAFQEVAINIVSGVILGIKKPFRLNDLIRIGDVFGTVKKLELRLTLIEGRDNEIIYVPNKDMIQNILVNYGRSQIMRKTIDVSVSYADDLQKAISVIKDAVYQLDYIDKSKGVDVLALEFGDSGIRLSVRFWFNFPHPNITYRQADHFAVLAIKKAVDENGLTIPFPIRTLDFNIKGGTPLSDELIKTQKK